MTRLLVDISAHGFGHLSQATAVVQALKTRRPDVDVTIRCGHPRSVFAARCGFAFDHVHEAVDTGQVMLNATTPDLTATLDAYRATHANWPYTVARSARRLESIRPNLLLADVPYVSLAAATQVGLPAIALCSLNWADVFRAYHPSCARIHSEILAAYNGAERFIQVEPHMPMRDLDNTVSVGPIARRGVPRRALLDAALGLGPDERVALVSLGGLPFELPLHEWPSCPGLHYVIDRPAPPRPDIHAVAATGLDFIDVLACADALVVKLGYGLAVEAAVAQRPMLYLRRGHFPDELSILDWLAGRVPAREITAEQLLQGNLEAPLRQLLADPPGAGANGDGAESAAAIVASYL
jgi:hypothetical protein